MDDFDYDLFAAYVISIDFFPRVMNDTHTEISSKAHVLLALFCKYTSEFQGFIDTYWQITIRELKNNNSLFLQNLTMIVDGLPSPCLLYLLDIIMTQTPPTLCTKTMTNFFAVLRALNARGDLTEQEVKEVLPFFFSISRYCFSASSRIASDWTQDLQTQLEAMIDFCVQRVDNKTTWLQQSLNAVVNGSNTRIHLLLIHAILLNLEEEVEYDFSNLFITLLQHVIGLIQNPTTLTPSSSIQSMLSVMGDCLSRMGFMPHNEELITLWSSLWTPVDSTLIILLVDFFNRNLSLMSHSLYPSFLNNALREPSFVHVALLEGINASARRMPGCASAASGRR